MYHHVDLEDGRDEEDGTPKDECAHHSPSHLLPKYHE
jgi:hypothetical protein